ncbi:MAG: phosphatidylserine decarboxylase family protein [Desulfobulbaceae bacterium]|uniref:Phosphatidylserine decarboxylase proenzyme n=1 Tax=Candidatus Desulfatifera sulfidica TaxID=2841691 RepID=A0A8J6TD79_9BACT|nr:phosphatidylserine decarboxylase family protein [Candidatus Desulfatifera sulfidica]
MIAPRIPMAKEGYPFIAFSAFVTLTLAFLEWSVPTLAALAVTGFITWFFRDPERLTPSDQDALICPADGKVILVEEVDDQIYLNSRTLKISIFMNIFNVHVNRSPCKGKVEQILHRPGNFYSADSSKAALYNETCATLLTTEHGPRIAVVQMAGLIARRIICWAEIGDTLKSGQRFGLIRFGSRVDLYLPLDTQVDVQVGDKVKAGETILGRLA